MKQLTIDVAELENGESIALGTIEIIAIPHVSIIDNLQNSNDEIVDKYKIEISRLLSEVYQFYKSISFSAGYSKDVAIDLLWTTKAVKNQPYNAYIKLYLIVRAIDMNRNVASDTVQNMMSLCESMLSVQKYDFSFITYSDLSSVIKDIDDSNIKAIVKEEKVEFLQNQILPYCYSYDVLPLSSDDLSKIVNILIDYPNSAVLFELIPTVFKTDESAEISRITQILETLRRGVTDHNVGNVSFAAAERHAEIYRYYSEHKSSPLFLFNVLIFGGTNAISNISNRVFSQLSTSRDGGNINLQLLDLHATEVAKNTNFYPLPWAVNELLINKGRDARIWSSGQFSEFLYRLPYIITVDEASIFFRLPIGSDRISAGLTVNESEKGSKTYTSNIINSGDITVGELRSSSNRDTIGVSLKDLAKHMLIVGTPGSGKTTFSVGLLDRLWKEHHIPFLVIEPAKNEYRALVQSIPELQVFTPGKNFISPFVFNPFVPPKNVKLETYKSTLKTAFAAGVSMSTPLDKIFEEAINNCYSDFRWLDSYTVSDKGNIFNISDFIKCFKETFDEIGYTGDAKNIGRAGLVRLRSLVNLFDNYYSIPIEDLLKKPTVIELAAIENSDQKALIIALLLLSILSYVNANYIGEGGLKNVIMLEEAHVLLDAASNLQGDTNPSVIAQGLLKRMLAEIRSYGVGIVVADQSPRKVSADVVALTDMKMVFRLVEKEDKQIISDSTNMSDAQMQRMSKLRPGEAFLFFNKLSEPEEVITPDYRLENNINISLSDESIKQLSTYWKSRQQFLRPYPECRFCKNLSGNCNYSQRILAREIARRIYRKNFTATSKDIQIVKNVFGQISANIKDAANGEPFTPELLTCSKVHIWRKLYYDTNIPITNEIINNSLKK